MEKLAFVFLLSCALTHTDCRQGWKTSGNGYFVYKASTDFNTTSKISITGKFSTKAGSMQKNVLVAVEDANGDLKLQVSANKGSITNELRRGQSFAVVSTKVPGSDFGYAFDFTTTLSQSLSSSGDWEQNLQSNPGYGITVKGSEKWDLSQVTIYIAGYRNESVISGNFFEGCLSNIVFQGTDVLATYFQQYPNNTNPVRGSLTVNKFSNVAETCDDVKSTVKPTTTSKVAPTTKGNSGNCREPLMVFTLVFACFAFLLH